MSHYPRLSQTFDFPLFLLRHHRNSNTNKSQVAPVNHSRCWKDLESIGGCPEWKDKQKPSPQTECGPEWRDAPETKPKVVLSEESYQ